MKTLQRNVDPWGRVSFNGDDAVELLMRGHDITQIGIEITPEIEAYNQACIENDKLQYIVHPLDTPEMSPEEDGARRQTSWWLPDDYIELDVRAKLLDLCQDQVEIDRVKLEMDKFEERGLLPVLRLMCFLVDRWRAKGVVWGVGRGSSVASYCLFLIGVHKINSIAFNLSIDEFLK